MTEEQVPTQEIEGVILRHLDSDDIMRLNGKEVITTRVADDGAKEMVVDIGQLMRVTIILGVKKCPWFSTEVPEDSGVSREVFASRDKEFRKIPVNVLTPLTKAVEAFNKASYDAEVFRKK